MAKFSMRSFNSFFGRGCFEVVQSEVQKFSKFLKRWFDLFGWGQLLRCIHLKSKKISTPPPPPYTQVRHLMSVWRFLTTFWSNQSILCITDSSVRNRSGIIAHEGLPNAKPLIVDFILLLPETNFRLKTNTDPK